MVRYPLLGRDFRTISKVIDEAKTKVRDCNLIHMEHHKLAHLLIYMEYLENEIDRLHSVIRESDTPNISGFWEEHRSLNAVPSHEPFSTRRSANEDSSRSEEDGRVLPKPRRKHSFFGSS